jgi:putative MFS transporter
MFGIVGVMAMFVWFLRKSMPESPRWLAAHGRKDEAENILQAIEAEAARKGPLSPVHLASREEQPAGSVWNCSSRRFWGALCWAVFSISSLDLASTASSVGCRPS